MFAKALIKVTQPTRCHGIQALTMEFLAQNHTNLPLLPLVQGKGRPCECMWWSWKNFGTLLLEHPVVFLQEKINCKTCIVDVQLSRYGRSPIFIHRSMSKDPSEKEVNNQNCLSHSFAPNEKASRSDMTTKNLWSIRRTQSQFWLNYSYTPLPNSKNINNIRQTSFNTIHIICQDIYSIMRKHAAHLLNSPKCCQIAAHEHSGSCLGFRSVVILYCKWPQTICTKTLIDL